MQIWSKIRWLNRLKLNVRMARTRKTQYICSTSFDEMLKCHA